MQSHFPPRSGSLKVSQRLVKRSALALAVLGIGMSQLATSAQAAALPVTSGLQCWFDASVGVTGSGAGVTGWADQSGNGHTATKTAGTLTLVSGALNGLPVIQFSGNAVAGMAGNMYSKTQFIVTKMNGGDWGAWMGSQVRAGYMWNQSGDCWNGNVPAAASKNGTALSNPFSLGADRASQYMVLKIVGNDANTSQRLYALGQTEGWNSLHNFMAEIIVYDRVLSTTEENLVGGYLAKKYAVSTTYPAYSLMVSVTSPANNQAYPTDTSVTAVATVPTLAGTGPYSVQFYKKVGAGSFAPEGSPVTGAGPTFNLSLGTLSDNTYQIYADVTDNVLATATSVTNTFTVAPPISTTMTLGSSPNPSTYGQSVTFTATVSGPPSGGTVQFYSDSSPLGSPVAVNTGTGVASYSTSLLSVPTHSITAHYSGHGVYLASDADALTQTVNKSALTVTAENKVRAPGTANPAFTYVITGYQNGENATSAGVTGTPVLGTTADTSSPAANYAITNNVSAMSAANYSFTAVAGNLAIVVGAPPTVAANMACWYDAAQGVTTNASGVIQTWTDQSGNGHGATGGGGSPTLALNQINSRAAALFRSNNGNLNLATSFVCAQQYVVFRSPNATFSNYGAVLGSTSARTYLFRNGNTDFHDNPVAAKKNGASISWSLAPITNYMVAVFNSQNPTTSYSWQINNCNGYSCDLDIAEIIGYNTALSGADETKIGSYLADKYAMTTAYPLLVPQAPAGLTATPLLHSVRLNWTGWWSATNYNVYCGTVPGVYAPTPIGSSGTATTYTDTHAPADDGTTYYYMVKAVNAAGESVASAEVSAAPSSSKADQTITFGALASKTYGIAPFALTATADSGLTVSYASSDPLVASVSSNIVTILKAGTTTITASQDGNELYNAAVSVGQLLSVSKANQTITFALPLTWVVKLGAAPFADTATGGASGMPVTYTSTNQAVATVNASGVVTLLGVGKTEIRANQLGDADHYNAATQVAQMLIVIEGPLPVTSGLVCWYDAGFGVTTDGSGVSVWADRSTLGHTATRASGTVTLAPNDVNSRPAVRLRGNGTYLSCAGAMFTKEQYVVVRSPTATWNGSGCFLGRVGDFLAVRQGSYNFYSGYTGFWDDVLPTAVSKNGTAVSSSRGSMPRGGFELGTITNYMLLKITVTAPQNPLTYPYMQIGKCETLGTMDFDVAEIVGYDTALSANDEAKVGGYLAGKYGITTTYPPQPPEGLTATAGAGQISLNWTAVLGATGYNVKRSETSGSGYAPIGTTAAATYTDVPVTAGPTFYYVVTATNSIGTSANSAEVSSKAYPRGTMIIIY